MMDWRIAAALETRQRNWDRASDSAKFSAGQLWVKCGHAEQVAAAAGSPQTADQLAVGQRDGGELTPHAS
jgi:hypothetical protein